MSVCPDCGGDGYTETWNDDQSDVVITLCRNPRCHDGELEPAGESVQARAERERALQGPFSDLTPGQRLQFRERQAARQERRLQGPGLGAWGEEAGDE